MKRKILTCMLILTLITTVSCNMKSDNSKNTDKNTNTTETVINSTEITDNGDKFVVKDGNHPKAEDLVLNFSKEIKEGSGVVDIKNNSNFTIKNLKINFADDNGNSFVIGYPDKINSNKVVKDIHFSIDSKTNFKDFRPIFHELEFENENRKKEISKYDYDLKEYY